MIDYIAIFVAGFVAVFAMGFQSRNVNTGKIKSAAVTSFMIAISQGTVFLQLARADNLASLLVYGLSGSCAIVCAMLCHDRVFTFIDKRLGRMNP